MPQPVTEQRFLELAKTVCDEAGHPWISPLEQLLEFCFAEPSFFPKKRGGAILQLEGSEADIQVYLRKYTGDYFAEKQRQFVLKAVGTTPDPAVDEVLIAFAEQPRESLSQISTDHRLSMAAENLIGGLLERYIAESLEGSGWICACGETLRSVDFFSAGPPVVLLQVKNRDNSENSSSSAIRRGTAIQKWYRIKSGSGQTNWQKLQAQIS